MPESYSKFGIDGAIEQLIGPLSMSITTTVSKFVPPAADSDTLTVLGRPVNDGGLFAKTVTVRMPHDPPQLSLQVILRVRVLVSGNATSS